MNTNTQYKMFLRFLAASLIAFSLPLAAAESLQLRFAHVDQDSFQGAQYEFEDVRRFERRKITKNFKVRGWQVARNVYLGQVKVAKKWGLGLVYKRGNTVFGMNNRGIQVMKRF